VRFAAIDDVNNTAIIWKVPTKGDDSGEFFGGSGDREHRD